MVSVLVSHCSNGFRTPSAPTTADIFVSLLLLWVALEVVDEKLLTRISITLPWDYKCKLLWPECNIVQAGIADVCLCVWLEAS